MFGVGVGVGLILNLVQHDSVWVVDVAWCVYWRFVSTQPSH